MKRKYKFLISARLKYFLALFLVSSITKTNSYSCLVELEKCTASVNPLLRNVSYMFPSSEEEVKNMCSSWSKLVDCVRKYVNNCFDQQRKQYFNAAVENSIGTVHAICSSNAIQREYLLNAKCFRRVSIDNCRDTYKQLVDYVSTPKSTDEQICCGYSKFRDCVNEPLGHECGSKARNLMHHSLAFLMQKCESQLDLGKYANQACPLLSIHRSLETTPDVGSTDLATNTAYPETENDYYLNEKHQDASRLNVATNAESQLQTNNNLVNANRTLGSTVDEPLAQNLRKAPSIPALDHSVTDLDYESELDSPSVDQVQHSTESPQSVYYDPNLINNGYIAQNRPTIFFIALIGQCLLKWSFSLK